MVFECRIFCVFCLLALTVADRLGGRGGRAEVPGGGVPHQCCQVAEILAIIGQNGPTKKFTGRIKPNFTKSERKGA